MLGSGGGNGDADDGSIKQHGAKALGIDRHIYKSRQAQPYEYCFYFFVWMNEYCGTCRQHIVYMDSTLHILHSSIDDVASHVHSMCLICDSRAYMGETVMASTQTMATYVRTHHARMCRQSGTRLLCINNTFMLDVYAYTVVSAENLHHRT